MCNNEKTKQSVQEGNMELVYKLNRRTESIQIIQQSK